MATPNFAGFSIKPVKKSKIKKSSTIVIKQALYCKPVIREDTLYAHINTKGLEGYDKITILPFSEESFNLKGKTHIFLKEKNDEGKYVHIIRNKDISETYPGNSNKYTPLCENAIYKGYIMKIEKSLVFNVTEYIGTVKANYNLLKTTEK